MVQMECLCIGTNSKEVDSRKYIPTTICNDQKWDGLPYESAIVGLFN